MHSLVCVLSIVCTTMVYPYDTTYSWNMGPVTASLGIAGIWYYYGKSVLCNAILPVYNAPHNDNLGERIQVADTNTLLNYHVYAWENFGATYKRTHDLQNLKEAACIIVYNPNMVSSSNNIELAQTIFDAVGAEKDDRPVYVFIFTYRGVGMSTGEFNQIDDLAEDGLAMFNMIHRTYGVPAEQIYHYGISLGTIPATQAVAYLHRHNIRCHLRHERGIAHLEGVVPDHIIPRAPLFTKANTVMRTPVWLLLCMHNLYTDVYSKWREIAPAYKDFRIAQNDEVIPRTASLYHAIREHEGTTYDDKVVSGNHNMFIIPDAWGYDLLNSRLSR